MPLLDEIVATAHRAGEAIMEIYATDFAHETKADETPVTAADLAAETVIETALADLTPDIPVVAEEAAAEGRVPAGDLSRFWLVDPLDGTREFLERNGEFTVNIALIEDGKPVLGVIHAPALDMTCSGIAGRGAVRIRNAGPVERLAVRAAPPGGLTIVASRHHGDRIAIDRLLAGRPVAEWKQVGSSLKFCLIAAGEADLYPRFGRTMEWDTAAGHAILAAAGGTVLKLPDRTPLRYGKPGWENPHFVALVPGVSL